MTEPTLTIRDDGAEVHRLGWLRNEAGEVVGKYDVDGNVYTINGSPMLPKRYTVTSDQRLYERPNKAYQAARVTLANMGWEGLDADLDD